MNVYVIILTEHQVKVYAAVIDKNATSLHRSFILNQSSKRWVIILGNEDKGISPGIISDNRIVKTRIDMVDGVDSLSINNACAIFLYAFVAASTIANV